MTRCRIGSKQPADVESTGDGRRRVENGRGSGSPQAYVKYDGDGRASMMPRSPPEWFGTLGSASPVLMTSPGANRASRNAVAVSPKSVARGAGVVAGGKCGGGINAAGGKRAAGAKQSQRHCGFALQARPSSGGHAGCRSTKASDEVRRAAPRGHRPMSTFTDADEISASTIPKASRITDCRGAPSSRRFARSYGTSRMVAVSQWRNGCNSSPASMDRWLHSHRLQSRVNARCRNFVVTLIGWDVPLEPGLVLAAESSERFTRPQAVSAVCYSDEGPNAWPPYGGGECRYVVEMTA